MKPSITTTLTGKWSSKIPFPVESSKQLCAIVAHLLENQEKYFDDCDNVYRSYLEYYLGDDYKDKILKGIAEAAFRSDIWDLISAQPMTAPASKVFYFSQSYRDDKIPEVKMSIESKEVMAYSQSLSCNIIKPIENKFGRDAQQDFINIAFAKAFDQLRQEIVGDLLIMAKHEDGVEPLVASEDHLLGAVINQAITIHRNTMRATANRIFCHPKHLSALKFLNDKFKVFSDWEFPENEVLLFYNGNSVLDQPYIFAPYRFHFYPENYTVFRHGKYLVHPEAIALVKIED